MANQDQPFIEPPNSDDDPSSNSSGSSSSSSSGSSESSSHQPGSPKSVQHGNGDPAAPEGDRLLMDSMAYLTQPDPQPENSDGSSSSSEDDDDDGSNGNGSEEQEDDGDNDDEGNGSDEDSEEVDEGDNDNDNPRAVISPYHANNAHQTPQSNKKARGGGGGRARKQSGDPLTMLAASPEGRQHSSTTTPLPAAASGTAGSAFASYACAAAAASRAGDENLPSSSLSQSLVKSPLRSPSPLIMSQPSPLKPSSSPSYEPYNTTNYEGAHESNGGDNSSLEEFHECLTQPALDTLKDEEGKCDENMDTEKTHPVAALKSKEKSLKKEEDLDLESSPMKGMTKVDEIDINGNDVHHKMDAVEDEAADVYVDAKEVDDSGINGMDKPPIEEVTFAPTDAMKPAESEQTKRKQRLLQKLKTKKQAILRSLCHLSDNSYTFVYPEPISKDGCKNDSNIRNGNDDDEPGLPFIGPDLKEPYEELRRILLKGLLGRTSDDDVGDGSYPDDGKLLQEEQEHANDDSNNNNPFLPKIKSNISAVLMGPRGHGKTLVVERCIASLNRLAGKQKQHTLEQIMMQRKQIPDKDRTKLEEMYCQASFGVVRLNGLLFQGHSALVCIREIARQIGVMSREKHKRSRKMMKQMARNRKRSRLQSSEMATPTHSSKKQRKKERSRKTNNSQRKLSMTSPTTPKETPEINNPTPNTDDHNLRIRKSGFNTYIALLDEALRTARIDSIPILIVLEEMDTFLAGSSGANLQDVLESSDGGNLQNDGGGSDRQLLLYHLLDRVADHKFLVSVVGTTTDLTAVTKLEKRVQSRAEGTSKFIYFGNMKDYDNLVTSVLGKFYTPPMMASKSMETDEYNEPKAMLDIREDVKAILTGGKEEGNLQDHQEEVINDFSLVQQVLQRNYNSKGSDMRWFCRLFDSALSLLLSDIDDQIYQCLKKGESDDDLKLMERSDDDIIPKLNPSHVAQALVAMNASLDNFAGPSVGQHPGIPTQGTLELIRWGQLIKDQKNYSCLLGTHQRLVALLDLSGPQVAVLLAARRIAARDDASGDAEDEMEKIRRKGRKGSSASHAATGMPLSLTFQRIQDEYNISFVASGRYTISSDRYAPHVLHKSCTDLMELDIIRLKKEQCVSTSGSALTAGSDVSKLPLNVNLEWDLEFMPALKAGLLQCSTALREWGMKMN